MFDLTIRFIQRQRLPSGILDVKTPTHTVLCYQRTFQASRCKQTQQSNATHFSCQTNLPVPRVCAAVQDTRESVRRDISHIWHIWCCDSCNTIHLKATTAALACLQCQLLSGPGGRQGLRLWKTGFEVTDRAGAGNIQKVK